VWHEFPVFCWQSQSLADALMHIMQAAELGIFFDTSIERVGFVAAKQSNAFQPQCEGLESDVVELQGYFTGKALFDVANETDGEVIMGRVHPAGTGNSALHDLQIQSDVWRNFQSGEEAGHFNLLLQFEGQAKAIRKKAKYYFDCAKKASTVGKTRSTISSTP
jgi:hypothetical protein